MKLRTARPRGLPKQQAVVLRGTPPRPAAPGRMTIVTGETITGTSRHKLFADEPLMERIGFLVRRLHQIHIAFFMEEVKNLDITTIQFTTLSILHLAGEIEQSDLAARVGMDRTNVSDVVRRLSERERVKVRVNPRHGRKRLVSLTAKGRNLLKKADIFARRAQERTISALAREDQDVFADMLRRLVHQQDASRPLAALGSPVNLHKTTAFAG